LNESSKTVKPNFERRVLIMADPITRFNRRLLVLTVVLYAISLAAFSYANWKAEPDQTGGIMVINALILSLPLVLFFGSAYVLISAWREHGLRGQISPRLVKVIHWAPRVAAIVIIFFVSLFSFDVFEMEATPLELVGAFLMHSLPSIFLILVLLFAWRRPVVGVIAFLIAGLFFMRFVIFGGGLGHFLLFSGPLLLISALFYADWRWFKPHSPASLEAAV
jgi:hypothetical protein